MSIFLSIVAWTSAIMLCLFGLMGVVMGLVGVFKGVLDMKANDLFFFGTALIVSVAAVVSGGHVMLVQIGVWQ